MSVLAPIVAADALAVVPHHTISATPEPSLHPTQLSLRGLLQYENVQTIQASLAALARFADHLPLNVGDSTVPVGADELFVMGRLVQDIRSSLEKIESLREEDEMLPDVADMHDAVPPVSLIAKRRRRERMKFKAAQRCHSCSRLETPQWRPGPDGPRTLCNVCGLVYTKRQQRRADQAVKAARGE